MESAPSVFLILKADLPPGLVIKPKTTRFTVEGSPISYRVDAIDNEAREPHVRLTTNLADR